jgi:hypothetical protein
LTEEKYANYFKKIPGEFMIRRVLQTGLFSVFLVACSFSAPHTPTSTPTIAPTATATTTFTPTPLPTATAVELGLKVIKDLVNCRSGPGVVFELINELEEGETARVVGRNADSTWWYIRDPGNPGGKCWVSADVSEINGNTSELPIGKSSAASVIDLELIVEPNRMVVSCFQFPQTFFFEARITADAPVIVLWQWEANTGAISETGTLAIETAGTKSIYQSYQVDGANDYWMKLNIFSPNPLSERVYFRAECS